MRTAFENGNIIEKSYYKNNEEVVKVTMTNLKCFKISKFNKDFNIWTAIFETSNKCTWIDVQRYVNCLIN